MNMSPATIEIMAALDALSTGTLKCRTDLCTLIELTAQGNVQRQLDDLSFTAKFLSKSHGIMQRIGRNGQGYDQLAKEFSSNLEKATTLIRSLVATAPIEVRQRFDSTYLSLTPESFRNLLSLFYDLSWYKNWRLDSERAGR